MRTPFLDAPDLVLSDLMEHWPETIEVFLRYRMLCVGCVFARFYTVEDACREHDVDVDEFRGALRKAMRQQV